MGQNNEVLQFDEIFHFIFHWILISFGFTFIDDAVNRENIAGAIAGATLIWFGVSGRRHRQNTVDKE